MAVCLCIIGILMSSFITGGSRFFEETKTKETHQKIDFVMNALSSYAQTHYRLPCPADPHAPPSQAGREEDGGKCFIGKNKEALYWELEGIVPWKELAIPQNMAVDAWGNYITYKPSPVLTVDNEAPPAQDTASADSLDVHNACRNAGWYDSEGHHLNRAKALFCCNAQPSGGAPGNEAPPENDDSWRNWGVVDAATAAAIEPAAGGSLPDDTPAQISNSWADSGKDPAFNGSFSIPHYMDGPATPLLRATGLAVVLISHGSAGNLAFLPDQDKRSREGGTVSLDKGVAGSSIPDSQKKNVWPPQMFAAVVGNAAPGPGGDIVSYLRSDQLFARTGSASCEASATALVQPYACVPQSFRNDNGAQVIRDPATGAMLPIPALYGVQLALTGKKYQLRVSLTKHSDKADRDDSVGFYGIGQDGVIGSVRILMKGTKDWAKGETEDFRVGFDGEVAGIGLFVIPDGNRKLDGYKGIDLSHLKFVTNYGQLNEKTASLADQTPPSLVTVDSGVVENRIAGTEAVTVYHLYSNLNPGRAGRTLRRDAICHIAGEQVGANKDVICAQPTSMDDAGVNPASPNFAWIGFEENPRINCYESRQGGCVLARLDSGADLLSDNEGGYIASIGDNSYDDLAFSVGLAACPQGQ